MIQPCPLCNSETTKHRFATNGFEIRKCSACTVNYVGNPPSQAELNQYYESEISDDVAYSDPENIINLRHYFLKAKDLIEKEVPPGRILDVGCSTGGFLSEMKGWDCYGIEVPSASAETAKATYADRIHLGTLEDCPFPDSFFDVISLQDVLDHMPDPLRSMGKCNQLLKPGGLILIKVHNIDCLYARVAREKFYAIIPPFHLFYYNRKSLGLLLDQSGFDFISSQFIGHILFLKTIPFRLSQGKRDGFTYQLFKLLSASRIGNLRIHKNLHDIITVIARKR